MESVCIDFVNPLHFSCVSISSVIPFALKYERKFTRLRVDISRVAIFNIAIVGYSCLSYDIKANGG